jgi:hypothetical protein
MLTKKAQTPKLTGNKTVPMNKNTFTSKVLGIILLSMSLSVFVQAVPLMYIFIGGYLGVPSDAKIGSMDTMVWILTSVTMMILSLYTFITWMKFLWRRFITNPTPLRLWKKKEKHAH